MRIKYILYDWEGLNLTLFHAVNNLHGTTYDHIMLLGTALAGRQLFPVYLAILVLLSLHASKRKPQIAQYCDYRALWSNIILVFIGAYLADCVFLAWTKYYFHYPRPFVFLPADTMRTLGSEPQDKTQFYASFPSGHAAFAMLIAASLWPALNRTGKAIFALFVIWACWSRIALGVHFPVDALSGSLSSLLIVLAVRVIIGKTQERKTYEKQ
jgi:membrane-associated phospholipid phosphatase